MRGISWDEDIKRITLYISDIDIPIRAIGWNYVLWTNLKYGLENNWSDLYLGGISIKEPAWELIVKLIEKAIAHKGPLFDKKFRRVLEEAIREVS